MPTGLVGSALWHESRSQRNIFGFYFDVRKLLVLFYFLIESVSFCCFFPNNSSQERINFWSERQHYYRSSKSGSFSVCFPKAQLVHCCSVAHKPRADTAHSQAGSGFLDFSMCVDSGLAVMLTWPRGAVSEAGVPVLQGATLMVLCDRGWEVGAGPSPVEVSAQGPLRCPGEVWNAHWLSTGDPQHYPAPVSACWPWQWPGHGTRSRSRKGPMFSRDL